jgi:uncharacterized circularly permuted ATP-grasp superfamily protein/uncharacterized alpha-E superfamily protein
MPYQPAINSLLQDYRPALSSYNELFTADNHIRPDWETFFSSLQELGYEELKNRNADILRLLKENGVAYNIYNNPSGQNRPWELDPIPQLITADEWKTIHAGLVQRAELFNLLLKDIYGSRSLIKNGIIPQELIYMHPGFIRNCVNIKLPADQFLPLYAADMARGIDGRLWVISDRTQAPSGAGYALENRFAISSLLPELFANLNVRRLSPYFDSLQLALKNMAPHNSSDPRIVILTPGSENETYFEHSYLASYLGLTLVQGNDLMVKDNQVWLKTIEGLEKIDVILRRLDDSYCDPLELRNDSLLGVPGLLQAVRKGNVAIANPLGSSIVENAGLVPFLPAVAKHFFGNELVMPSIATWWCGQPKEMNYVIEHLHSLVIRKIFRDVPGTRSAVDGASLSSTEADDLVRQIKANPHLFAGQEKINFSSTPSWFDGKIEAGRSLFRSFLVSHNNTYLPMPGGLTRTNTGENSFIISNQSGGISKDTWVLSDNNDKEQPIHLVLNMDSQHHELYKRSLPSQTAENLFWVGRYTERVINNARLKRTVMQRILQSKKSFAGDDNATETILLQTLTQCTYTFPGFLEESEGDKNKASFELPWIELTDILYNERRSGSLSYNLSLLKNAVYSVRNFWSVDTWRVLRQMEEDWNQARERKGTDHFRMINAIDTLNTSMFAFLGMNRESVRREQGWNILDLGRKLEQSLQMIILLKTVFQKRRSAQVEYELMEAVMNASQSLITYRYTYRDHLQLKLSLELLLLDINYPKSLVYLTERIKRHISMLPNGIKGKPINEKRRNMEEADSLLKLASLARLTQYDPETGEYTFLIEFLDKLYSLLANTSDLISKTYFKHSQVQKQLFTANFI